MGESARFAVVVILYSNDNRVKNEIGPERECVDRCTVASCMVLEHASHEALWEEEVRQRKALGLAVHQPVAHELDAELEVFDPRCQRLE